ncbi:SHOCT domain-containing protein [Streptomyces sp. NPDC048331]|uniref:SHOCT domain-containing protein n=1 Tax=Streptomyces sp. NPDC048331 TaxID=3365534 RepID=UPI003717ECDA
MFIRPMGVTVRAADRPPGHPLLRGLLARASGAAEATAGSVGTSGPAGPAGPAGGSAGPASARPPVRTEPPAGAQPAPPAEALAEAPVGAWTEPPPEPVQRAEPEPPAASTPDHPAPAGLVAELTQLAELAREGLLTPQEFTTAKARLLRG